MNLLTKIKFPPYLGTCDLHVQRLKLENTYKFGVWSLKREEFKEWRDFNWDGANMLAYFRVDLFCPGAAHLLPLEEGEAGCCSLLGLTLCGAELNQLG